MTGSERDALRRVRARISGRVQGVAYRWWARERATAIGLSGWVRNLPGGDVEAVFEGDPAAVERMIESCRAGPSAARVTAVDVNDEPPRPESSREFEIRY